MLGQSELFETNSLTGWSKHMYPFYYHSHFISY